jgi:hypothetical protein
MDTHRAPLEADRGRHRAERFGGRWENWQSAELISTVSDFDFFLVHF